jgi:hypothetical protein
MSKNKKEIEKLELENYNLKFNENGKFHYLSNFLNKNFIYLNLTIPMTCKK